MIERRLIPGTVNLGRYAASSAVIAVLFASKGGTPAMSSCRGSGNPTSGKTPIGPPESGEEEPV